MTKTNALRLLDQAGIRYETREYEDAFQPFAKDQHADVEERDRGAGLRPHRIGRALGRDSLPNQNGDHGGHRDHQEHLREEA